MDIDQNQALLTINSGSSSLKFALFARDEADTPQRLYRGEFTAIGAAGSFRVHNASGDRLHAQEMTTSDHAQTLKVLLEWLSKQEPSLQLAGVGHRIVHGGRRLHMPVHVSDDTIAYLHTLIPLAPNHQPACLMGITALQVLQPRLPQVACFDTAFHHKHPTVEQHFALPALPVLDEVRRYGFHGLSYEYIASVLPDHLGALADGKIIVAHLGHGASLCAIHQRRSIATTMTFTPLDGIPMGTRCGSIDPAVSLYLQNQGMTADEVSDLLYFQSGLLGISGETDDMAELLVSSSTSAKQAVDYFVHHTVRAIGSLAAALSGIDALVFTGGIGEHAAPIREAICKQSEWLGLHLDTAANQLGQSCISQPDSPVQAWVIPTDEESVIARHSLRVLKLTKQRNMP